MGHPYQDFNYDYDPNLLIVFNSSIGLIFTIDTSHGHFFSILKEYAPLLLYGVDRTGWYLYCAICHQTALVGLQISEWLPRQ